MQVASSAITGPLFDLPEGDLHLGSGLFPPFSISSVATDYTGWIDEFSLKKGVAVYTSDFTPAAVETTCAL